MQQIPVKPSVKPSHIVIENRASSVLSDNWIISCTPRGLLNHALEDQPPKNHNLQFNLKIIGRCVRKELEENNAGCFISRSIKKTCTWISMNFCQPHPEIQSKVFYHGSKKQKQTKNTKYIIFFFLNIRDALILKLNSDKPVIIF